MALTIIRKPAPPVDEVLKLAEKLYTDSNLVAPSWGQLGAVTQGVWKDRAVRKLAGHLNWWSINPKPERA
jgi:hypothetical protein